MAGSINTNLGAMTALYSLNQTASQLSTSMGRRGSAAMNAMSSGSQFGSTQGLAGAGDRATFSFDSSGSTSDAQARLAQLTRDSGLAAESVQLQALQTRQQLGVQALSMANQAPQSLMKLFG